MDRVYGSVDDAHVLVWIPTCAQRFSTEAYNMTRAHTSKLAVLDESDGTGNWAQVNGKPVGMRAARAA